jgi:hypothetical protein
MKSRAQATFLLELAGSFWISDLSSRVADRVAGANRTRIAADSQEALKISGSRANTDGLGVAPKFPWLHRPDSVPVICWSGMVDGRGLHGLA